MKEEVYFFILILLWIYVTVSSRKCHYCNIVTDFSRPLNRTSCEKVKKEIKKDGSLYTKHCPSNQYCMYFKGQYRDTRISPSRYEEFAGCSGDDNIYIGDVTESEKATGDFVDWKRGGRDGKICLSRKDKSCFATSRTCHYCNIVTDFTKPWDRIPCEKVKAEIMRNGTLYTKDCPLNQYCLYFKGQYKDTPTDPAVYKEFASCSGDNGIHHGHVESVKATGTFVDWKTNIRDGKICLSREDKSCFGCDKFKCDEFWPKPDCPTGKLVATQETSDECCPEYKCMVRTCYYCNIITDIWEPLNRTSCDTIRTALMKDKSQYTITCNYNEYCMYYKGLYKHGYYTNEFYVEYGGCSGKEEKIYIEDNKVSRITDGTFIDWKTVKRNGRICLSANDKSCFDLTRTCYYCSNVIDVQNSCETVRNAVMVDRSLHTVNCSYNEYCMHFKGMYKDGNNTPERYVEYAGCSGKEDEIYTEGDKGPGNTDGTMVHWKTPKRNGIICLSVKDMSCFVTPPTCYSCGNVTDVHSSLNRSSCETVRKAVMKDSSLHTVTCDYNEYCMYYKGLYTDKLGSPERLVEYAWCSGKEEIYIGRDKGPESYNGTFVHWSTLKRTGTICLSLKDRSCFECNNSKCDELWPKPECPYGTLKLVKESSNECCPDYKCEMHHSVTGLVVAVVVAVLIISSIIAGVCVLFIKKKRNRK